MSRAGSTARGVLRSCVARVKKKPRKRARTWDEERLRRVRRLAEAGFTQAEIAGFVGVTERQLRAKVLRDKSLSGVLKRGRPKWEPNGDELKEIEKLATMHCTLAQIAAWLGVSEATVDRRMTDTPEFRAMIERGWQRSGVAYTQLVWKHAKNDESRACPKAMGLLGARFGWGEKFDHRIDVGDYRSKIKEMLTGADADSGDTAEPPG